MKYSKPISFIASLTFTLGVGVIVAHAQNYTPLAPLPGTFTVDTTTGKNITNMGDYLAGSIKLLIAIGAAVSIFVGIIGGTQYVAAGISPDGKSNAKNQITNAFIGLALVISSYLILDSINPKLVQFDLTLNQVTPAPLGVAAAVVNTGNCPFPPLPPVSADAQIFENGQTVSFTAVNLPPVQDNLTKLQTEVNKFKTALTTAQPGSSIVINSAYRPMSYQRHLWEVSSYWFQGNPVGGEGPLKDNFNSACSALKAQVGAEITHHKIGSMVSNPSICAPHVRGIGVDLKVTGISAGFDINTFLISKGIDLLWQGLSNDPVHYNLQRAPFIPPGC